jgi:hypothetical protein
VTLRRAIVAVVLIASTTSCGQGLLFSQDRRIEIVSPPKDNAKMSLPLDVRWQLADGVEVGRDIASFAVFFDVEPQPPDETIEYFSRRDTVCKRSPGCPDAGYFSGRGIHVTKDTSFHLDDILPVAGVDLDKGDHDRHDVTIIVLDAQGRRVTEASWARTFEIVHPEQDD